MPLRYPRLRLILGNPLRPSLLPNMTAMYQGKGVMIRAQANKQADSQFPR